MENDQKQRNKKEKEIKVAQEEVEDATEYGEKRLVDARSLPNR